MIRKCGHLLFFALLLVISCQEENRFASDFLQREAKKKDIDYNDLLTQSFDGDSLAIVEIATLKFGNSANYENGSNLLEIIDSVGEDKVIKIVRNCSNTEKNTIYYNLLAGTDYTSNEKFKFKDIESIYPDLYNELKR